MTIQAWWLLRKLKKAQIHLDGYTGIDDDAMAVVTIHSAGTPAKSVSVKWYKNSLESTLTYLEEQKCIERDHVGNIQVTYSGWHILSATAVEITKIVLLNVILPIVVSLITTIIATKTMTGS